MKKLLIALTLLLPGIALACPVNINTASKAELMTLKGVGEEKAKDIIKYRKSKKFKRADEITAIKGIGEASLAKNKKCMKVSGATKVKAAKADSKSKTKKATKKKTDSKDKAKKKAKTKSEKKSTE